MQKQLKLVVRELRLRNYSPRTVKSYLYGLRNYFKFKKSDFRRLDQQNIRNFLLHAKKKNLSAQTRNLYLNAIKFYYHQVVKTHHKIQIKTAKRPQSLPVILSRQEIKEVIAQTNNAKHKLILALAYGAGLRVSEVVKLKVNDINLESSTIHLKRAKGGQDRLTIFPDKLKTSLSKIWAQKSKDDFVFSSQQGGRLSTRTAQKIFKASCKKAKIKKDATFHSLRHSFATHLIEDGVDIRYVQKLLGHQNIRTTQRYTRVTNSKLKNIKSPLG
jgi:site-specific recombinase XerD